MKNYRSHNGFTLVEISIALLVIGIGVLAIVGVSSSSLNAGRKAREELDAVSFADMVFGYYRTTDWDQIPGSGVYDYSGNQESITTNTRSDYTNGTIAVTYELEVIPDGKNIKALSLHVWPQYQDANNDPYVFYTEIYNWRQK